MHLDGYLLIIADRCHICFACHFQTVHPIPVIFISFSTKIISSFQRHAWFSKLMPCSSFSFWSPHMHCISDLAYHVMFCIMLLVHYSMFDCGSIACAVLLNFCFCHVATKGRANQTMSNQTLGAGTSQSNDANIG